MTKGKKFAPRAPRFRASLMEDYPKLVFSEARKARTAWPAPARGGALMNNDRIKLSEERP
jgi:hypothetical protein